MAVTTILRDQAFCQWVGDLKKRIQQSQIKAAIKVNSELLHLYWDLGRDIAIRQMDAAWGSRFFERLSKELLFEFPDIKGFSATNLKYCKRFFLLYSPSVLIRQQVADELQNCPIFLIPWWHHIEIMSKCNSVDEALFYVRKALENGWSRAILANFIESGLYAAHGKSINNFERLLPPMQSDLAKESIKNPYIFDFLALTEDHKEKELEDALTTHITKFLLELGQGFAYIGRQVPIQIGKKERYIDLLFYHLDLRCYIVIELKAKEFEAGHTGQLGLYISAINHQRKKNLDNPTIGLVICKNKDNIEAEYSVESCNHPIGISEYQLSKCLPDHFKSSLPSIEEIEEGLRKADTE